LVAFFHFKTNLIYCSNSKKKPIDRPWVAHLAENKAKWQVLAEAEKQAKEAAAAAAAENNITDGDNGAQDSKAPEKKADEQH
jgi:hypothetical protein